MNPQIRYTKTSDGVSIAFTTVGAGPAFVWATDMPFSHLQFEFTHSTVYEDPEWQHFFKRRTMVRFDPRGMGLSDRSIKRLGLDEWVLDLEAIVDRLDLQSFSLMGITNGGPVAIAYAARHPDRVSHLILRNTGARPADGFRTPRAQMMAQMLLHDFEMFSENAGSISFGWGADRGRTFSEFIKTAVTPETARHSFAALNRIDVASLLPSIQAPTLIMYNSDLQYITREMTLELASQIPNARLLTLEGTLADDTKFPSLLLEFLDDAEPSKPATVSEVPGGTAIILFADIVDSTALTERLGDDAFRDKARRLDEAMRAAIRDNGGTPIEGKTLGDGVLAVFRSARQAITCAKACHEAATAAGLALHAGIHAGDVIREADNVYGGAVNIAARVAAASPAGETLVSATVRDLARTSGGVAFEDRGEQSLKGVDDLVRVFAVSWLER